MCVTGGAARGAPHVRCARQDEVVGPELVAHEIVGVVPPVIEAEIDEVQKPVLLLVGQDQEIVGENLEELFLRALVLDEDVDGGAHGHILPKALGHRMSVHYRYLSPRCGSSRHEAFFPSSRTLTRRHRTRLFSCAGACGRISTTSPTSSRVTATGRSSRRRPASTTATG